MTSRDQVLSSITSSLKKAKSRAEFVQSTKPTLPYIRQSYQNTALDEFIARAKAVQLTINQIDLKTKSVESIIPQAVQAYMEAHGDNAKDTAIDIAPELNQLDWSSFNQAQFGSARASSLYSVTACIAGVGETASLVLASSSQHPDTLNFLPENHIVVLYESQIVDYLEDVWPIIREFNPLPRVINFNTGPSRTGDIEQIIEVGAHGPRQMHVILIHD